MNPPPSPPAAPPGRPVVARRIAARAIDLFTVFFCAFALAVTALVPVMAPLTDLLDRGPWGRGLAPALLIAVVGVTYETVFTAGRGQTPAKDLLHLRVVDASTARPPTVRRAAIRATLLWSWLLVPSPAAAAAVAGAVLVGAGLAAVDPSRRGVHDRVLRTEVEVYDANAVEGPIVATPPVGAIEARYGARSWWRTLTGTVTR